MGRGSVVVSCAEREALVSDTKPTVTDELVIQRLQRVANQLEEATERLAAAVAPLVGQARGADASADR
jgi:hypothetical protein